MLRRLLAANPSLRGLLSAQLVSEAGTWIAYVAVTVAVYNRTGSAVWVGAVLLAEFLPGVVFAPLLGRLVDRVPRRRLLIGADLTSAMVFAVLPFATGPAVIVALALLAGTAGSVFRPSLASALPNLVRDEDLGDANAVLQATGNLGLALGPVLAGVLVAAAGTGVALWANAASFVVSALLLVRIPGDRFQEERTPGEPDATTGGLRHFARDSVLRAVLVACVLASLGAAAINVGEILIAQQTFAAGTAGFGLIASSCGAGLLLGSWLSGRALAGREPLAVFAGGIGLAAVSFGAAAAAPSIWLAAAFALSGGAGNGLLLVGRSVFFQRSVADASRGRVFAVLYGCCNAALGTGMVLSGLVGAAFGARALWGSGALLLGLATVAALSARPVLRAVRTAA